MRRHHAQIVGRGLQLTVAALLAGRAKVIALDKKHLGQGEPLGVDFRRIAFNHHAGDGAHGARRGLPAIDLDGAQFAGTVRLEIRVIAQVRNEHPGLGGGLDDGLAIRERNGFAIENESLTHASSPNSSLM
ncbi:MAG: hypothetical protein ACD_10C00848G0001, partial [uncultured bacterium]